LRQPPDLRKLKVRAFLHNCLKAQSHYFHPVPITASSWRVTAAIGTFWCDGDDLLTLAPIRLPIGPPDMA
jgi:hypothetical protein